MPLRQGENHFTVLQGCTKCWGIPAVLCVYEVTLEVGPWNLRRTSPSWQRGRGISGEGGRRFTVCMETSESPVVHAQWNWDGCWETKPEGWIRVNLEMSTLAFCKQNKTKQSKTLYSQGFVLIQLDLPLQVNPNDWGLTPMFSFSRTGFDFSQK